MSKFIATSEEEMDFLLAYMEGFWSHLKSPQEKSYCAGRSNQLVYGFKRPQGMSAEYGVRKDRVRNLEIVIRKVWIKGCEKVIAQRQQAQAQELAALLEELQLVS